MGQSDNYLHGALQFAIIDVATQRMAADELVKKGVLNRFPPNKMLQQYAVTQLEQFISEEACRLEQAAVLTGRAREFLKEQHVLEPAEFRIARIVGEQRSRARENIFRRVAASVPNSLGGTLEDLLVVKPDENSSGLQTIKANPSKPSVDAMLTLLAGARAGPPQATVSASRCHAGSSSRPTAPDSATSP
jgi:hypothetical protein